MEVAIFATLVGVLVLLFRVLRMVQQHQGVDSLPELVLLLSLRLLRLRPRSAQAVMMAAARTLESVKVVMPSGMISAAAWVVVKLNPREAGPLLDTFGREVVDGEMTHAYRLKAKANKWRLPSASTVVVVADPRVPCGWQKAEQSSESAVYSALHEPYALEPTDDFVQDDMLQDAFEPFAWGQTYHEEPARHSHAHLINPDRIRTVPGPGARHRDQHSDAAFTNSYDDPVVTRTTAAKTLRADGRTAGQTMTEPVTEKVSSPAGWFVLVNTGDGSEMPLTMPGVYAIGRDPASDIYLSDDLVSRRHAELTVSGTMALLHDVGSSNGTYVGGVLLREPMQLTGGETINFGGRSGQELRLGWRGKTVPSSR